MGVNNTHEYGWESQSGLCSSNYIVPAVLKILHQLRPIRVADIGSGNGHLCSVLSVHDFDVVGIEYDKSGVQISKDAHPDIPFYNYGVESDPADLLSDERKFDCVVSTEVIEHLYSPHLLARYAYSILEDGGYLIISTPYHGYAKNLALAILGKWDCHHTPLWHGGHIKFWSKDTLVSLLEENGFRYVSFTGVGRLPWIWKSMIILAKKV